MKMLYNERCKTNGIPETETGKVDAGVRSENQYPKHHCQPVQQ
jgi:hypothetical protein